MDIKGWARDSAKNVREDGIDGARESFRPVVHRLSKDYTRITEPRQSIYADDWELLIVLDACRLDLMESVAPEYEFINEVESRRSVGTATREWMRNTFTDAALSDSRGTAYLCGNPFSDELLQESQFALLDHVWQRAWIEPGTVPPEAVTDATIRAGRSQRYDRLIAHYMQPHCPFIPAPDLGPGKDLERFGNQPHGDIWDRLKAGEVTEHEVRDAYQDNLRLVLDDVGRLLENIDAEKVAITSDHGNGYGEWGVYSHSPYFPFRCVREVPWVKTEAEDKETASPDHWESDVGIDRTEQLESLGYL